jgi:hypothetical protein
VALRAARTQPGRPRRQSSVTFEIADGTRSEVVYVRHARTGINLERGGLSVPSEFGSILDRALEQQSGASG